MKFRTSYPKEMKQEAKAAGKGMFTLNVHFPDGSVQETQGPSDATELRFLRWAAALVCDPSLRPLPDLEQLVRQHVQKHTDKF